MSESSKYFKKRDQVHNTEIQSIIRLISNWMAVPLFLIFWIADSVLHSEKSVEFLCVRLLIIPICIIINRLIRKSDDYEKSQVIATVYAVSIAGLINYIIFRINDTSTSYYAGLNLIAIGGLSFIPFRRKYLIVTAAGIYVPYMAMIGLEIINGQFKVDTVGNVFFIIGSIIICSLIRFFNEKLRNREIHAKNELEIELVSRELVIIKKTEEATKLHQLSSQFSPQIIKAIRGGQISIDEDVKRAEICAIFIDIVKSTDKVTRLHEKDMQLSLARFLDTTLTTFLKYDLTIDKFHGDGVLAFSNMPIARTDFISRTCMAALEAVQAIQDDKEFYMKHWKSELQVRVGISTGFANVGFYGDQKYFKTFTAIGIPLPYASRLTSVGDPNQILIDHKVAAVVNEAGFWTEDVGRKYLKGFDEDTSSIFRLISAPQIKMSETHINASGQNGSVSQVCPKHPSAVMFLDTNDQGHYIFKCRDCENDDEIPKVA